MALTDTLPLHRYVEFEEVVLDLCNFMNSLCPPDIAEDSKHRGYEPTYFGGNFPASAAFLDYPEEYPKSTDNTMQPGVVNIVHRLYLPSIISVGDSYDASPRSGAQLESLRLRSKWRENLFDPNVDNFNMGGRVYRIILSRGESGDADRLGFPLAWDEEGDTTTFLWVDDARIRVEL